MNVETYISSWFDFFLLYIEIYVVITISHRKDQKKVTKLEVKIPYVEGRENKEEVDKIKQQIESIWVKTREAAFA